MTDVSRAPRSSLRRDFAVNLIGNVGYAAAQWAMLLVLVRLGSPAMVGEYSLALAIGAPVVMFTNLRLAYLLASDAARSHSYSDYFSLRLAANVVAMLVIIAWATIGDYTGDTWVVIVLVGTAKIAEAFSDLAFGYLSLRMRFAAVAASLSTRGWGTVLIMAALRAVEVPLTGVAAALAGWWWLVYWQVDLRLVRAARLGDDPATAPPPGVLALLRAFRLNAAMRTLIWKAVPLGVVALSLSLMASIPRLTIARELGADAVGYFSALAYVMVAGRMVAVALGTPTLPRLGGYVASGDRPAFVRTVARVMSFGLIFGAAGIAAAALLGRPALVLVYGPDYAAQAPVLTWLMLATGLGYLANFLEDSLVAMRLLRQQAALLLLTLAAIVAGCLWLIPAYGLMGAAKALVIGACVELVGASVLFWRGLQAWPSPEQSRPPESPRFSAV